MIYSQYDWSSSLAPFGCVCEKKDEGKVERRCKCSAGEGERKQMWIPLIYKLRGAANKCCAGLVILGPGGLMLDMSLVHLT